MDIKSILAVPCLLTDHQKLALAYCAASQPTGATIVEVGPYRGGSTKILAESSNNCDIHTIDLFDNIDRKLIGSNPITPYIGSSDRFAIDNSSLQADMVFIDGDHSFFGAMHDFTSLAPLMAPQATVAFHDYSFTYPGVRIFCDALTSAGIIENGASVDNMLVCNLTGNKATLSKEDYVKAVQKYCTDFAESNWGTRTVNQSHDYGKILAGFGDQWKIIGKGSMGAYFANFFSVDYDGFINSGDADTDSSYVICSYAYDDIERYLTKDIGVPPTSVAKGVDVLSYGIHNDLCSNAGKKLMTQCAHQDESLLAALFSSIPTPLLNDLYLKGALLNTFMRTSFL